MNEPKFRAWDAINKVWLNYLFLRMDGGHPMTWDGERLKEVQHPEDVTLMQYTGLKDKNGKEIFEGDILRKVSRGLTMISKVAWNDHNARFVEWGDGNGYGIEVDTMPTEVIGNIYDNPELLNSEAGV